MNWVSTPPTTISETCSCGAEFSVSGFSSSELNWMAEKFRLDHRPCRGGEEDDIPWEDENDEK